MSWKWKEEAPTTSTSNTPSFSAPINIYPCIIYLTKELLHSLRQSGPCSPQDLGETKQLVFCPDNEKSCSVKQGGSIEDSAKRFPYVKEQPEITNLGYYSETKEMYSYFTHQEEPSDIFVSTTQCLNGKNRYTYVTYTVFPLLSVDGLVRSKEWNSSFPRIECPLLRPSRRKMECAFIIFYSKPR